MSLANRLIITLIAVAVLLAQGCVPDTSVDQFVKIDLSHPQDMRNLDMQDLQRVDSLLSMTSDEKSNNRFAVANAFGSFVSKKALDSLALLLQDPIEEVRIAAAYALGQSGMPEAADMLTSAFVSDPELENNTRYNQTILEAIGKVGDDQLHDYITNVKNYTVRDTKLLKGQALALYRFALREIVSQDAMELMVDRTLDRAIPMDTRLIAVNYLARAKDIQIDSSKYRIIRAIQNDPNVYIKMALATAIKKVKDPAICQSLLDLVDKEEDYRVRVNLLRSLSQMPYDSVSRAMRSTLRDSNIHVAQIAAEYFIKHGQTEEAKGYITLADSLSRPAIQARLYHAANLHMSGYLRNSRERLNNKILATANKTKNAYDKLTYYQAIAAHPSNYLEVKRLISNSTSPVIRTQLLAAMGDMISSPKFTETYRTRSSRRYFKRDMLSYMQGLMMTEDPGLIAVGSGILAKSESGFDQLGAEYEWLDSLRSKLDLPKEIEAYQEIDKAIASLIDGRKRSKVITSKDNRINWGLLNGVTDTTQAQIITDKGTITFEVYPAKAPGTVANFISLANKNYYDNKVFHRVVPNFVIQGGCDRGDGYGSLDYNIRSETPQMYYDTEGRVGMASAGKHTESSQFFITHSPTMHLDGLYTIFGQVTSGMDVVHSIQPGDMIKDVRIIK